VWALLREDEADASFEWRLIEPGDLLHCPCVFGKDILGSELNVEQSRMDAGVTHEPLQSRQADAGADHVTAKGMAKPVRVGRRDPACQPVMPEQGTQSGRCHRLTARLAFQGNEYFGRIGQRPFGPEP